MTPLSFSNKNCVFVPVAAFAKGETTGKSLISSATGETGWIKLIPSPGGGGREHQTYFVLKLNCQVKWRDTDLGVLWSTCVDILPIWPPLRLPMSALLLQFWSFVRALPQLRVVVTATCKFTSSRVCRVVGYWLHLRSTVRKYLARVYYWTYILIMTWLRKLVNFWCFN